MDQGADRMSPGQLWGGDEEKTGMCEQAGQERPVCLEKATLVLNKEVWVNSAAGGGGGQERDRINDSQAR